MTPHMREPITPPTHAPRQTVFWVIAILLAVNATALILRSDFSGRLIPTALADSPTMAGARGIFAFTGQIDVNRYGLFMMDVDTRRVWCYEYQPSTRRLQLVAARSFDYDRYLDDYNNDPKTNPDAIKGLLDVQRQVKERKERESGADQNDEILGTSVPGMPNANEPQP